ncbi:hypothetical protein TSUD_70330 [Trifolium subterraneum]|uniref:Inhibitor I9 domain-containing protein n=1 Tax=Trifolium subterraneum TaxID=3900 RepID=A0A2Z6MPC1_TRISU|nr:hypothetical protein TSUD_70330 [Trifolium subterraneum]
MMMMMRMFLKPSHSMKPFDYTVTAATPSSSGAKRCSIHVVQCNEKPKDKDPEDFYIQTLTAVLGSEEAAQKAYIFDLGGYNGFAVANLTPEQADQISSKATMYFSCL